MTTKLVKPTARPASPDAVLLHGSEVAGKTDKIVTKMTTGQFTITADGTYTSLENTDNYNTPLRFVSSATLLQIGGVLNTAVGLFNDALGGHLVLANLSSDVDALAAMGAHLNGSGFEWVGQYVSVQQGAVDANGGSGDGSGKSYWGDYNQAGDTHLFGYYGPDGKLANYASVSGSGPLSGFNASVLTGGPTSSDQTTHQWEGSLYSVNGSLGDLNADTRKLWNAEAAQIPGLGSFDSLTVSDDGNGNLTYSTADGANSVGFVDYGSAQDLTFAFTSTK
jgi:hypothetical protein